MKKKKILLTILTVILLVAIIWCINIPYQEVNVTDNLKSIQKSGTCLAVHELYKDEDWDTMIVIKPYDSRTASDEKIDMGYAGDRDAILDNTLYDSICTLLFLKGNKLVAFSSIYRNVIDFSKLGKTTYKSTESIRIVNKTAIDCQ
ncbi:hypothetical protein [Prevotella fusca]|jgi:hypothetical protein|uniref:Uncharacterized protein n=1 Tax=Prevotella fusca JCM 17724 TaxID=1236517 RepID=A0A0K1NMQ1_9BACT|nr:hypothetical protein [Prevotella fusca]AKU69961.1 hypothetical protein ADJ77_08945 [Prevotella fusca JCM 17724]QUB85572.1 hypothetical protein J5A51_04785 [Prevotella fusca JCM 17724]